MDFFLYTYVVYFNYKFECLNNFTFQFLSVNEQFTIHPSPNKFFSFFKLKFEKKIMFYGSRMMVIDITLYKLLTFIFLTHKG